MKYLTILVFYQLYSIMIIIFNYFLFFLDLIIYFFILFHLVILKVPLSFLQKPIFNLFKYLFKMKNLLHLVKLKAH